MDGKQIARLAQDGRSRMSGAKIQIDACSKSFGDVLALAPVDLDLDEGSFTCFLGPSGCGKSTLLNMIAGFLRPSSGRILVDNCEVTAASADRGVVFQEFALFPWLTALRNVEFGLQMKGASKDARRQEALRYLDLVGLAAHRNKFPGALSGGMKQRVAIARALAAGPSVLLMDEPFGALDAQTREIMQDELLAICERERKTVIFVTHSISEAVFLGDKVVVMGERPGIVRRIFDLTMPHPRDRLCLEFVSIEREIKVLVRAG
jgi:NitT/TauT family transport system ATP-binding protein